MLTPLQSAQSTAAISAMQSIVETIEDRRREEAEKASGRKNDDIREQAHLQSDDTARQANARINEHFFGSNARGGETLAKVIARFSDTLGITQQDGESARAFAQRLSDRITLVDSVGLAAKGTTLDVSLRSLGTTLSSVKEAMSGPSDDAAANLVARLALATGVAQGEDEADANFEQRLSAMLARERGELPADVATLERKSGLTDLGLSASDIIGAIRNPYGTEAQRVKDALAEKAEEEKALTPEMRKVLARLEDAADPKSIEELKLERTKRDPTRVEDAETRKEREETIGKLEAGEKLEDVEKLQDAVGRANEDAVKGKADGRTPTEAVDTIQLLAAGAEATEIAEKAPVKSDRDASAETDTPAESTGEAVRNLDAAGVIEQQEREEAKKGIFALRVDDNGIYDLITRQLVA
ncbi:hypothetical protein [Shinella zoogloeoides]|uniref:Uncharacterized protein n=1 Tax=Shinella zoogloeoides TaxID=352475 RepID=A0A6N8TKE9_SHIZO|nr:hypothetical protein [Shinella zoogloeoides]MXO01600.1 hypothetical protein [Shinella zoogloeoides]UEX82051.1 hypothetical protein K8M09_01765 [Shinella zoogloeoides]